VPGLRKRLRLLTAGVLTGDEREITTLLAHVVPRRAVLDFVAADDLALFFADGALQRPRLPALPDNCP
jgi:hypothetical protein